MFLQSGPCRVSYRFTGCHVGCWYAEVRSCFVVPVSVYLTWAHPQPLRVYQPLNAKRAKRFEATTYVLLLVGIRAIQHCRRLDRSKQKPHLSKQDSRCSVPWLSPCFCRPSGQSHGDMLSRINPNRSIKQMITPRHLAPPSTPSH